MMLIYLLYVYFIIGIAIAIWFIFYKITRVDAAAKGTSFWFKLLLLPASVLLWPIILYKLNISNKQHG